MNIYVCSSAFYVLCLYTQGDNTMSNAIRIEKTFVEFFHAVKEVLRDTKPTDSLKVNEPEVELISRVDATKLSIQVTRAVEQ